jgi:transcriptional regulator with XRE-family HTH domain
VSNRGFKQLLCFIGANAHRLRKEMGLTQEQVAGLAGVELSFYQRIERAKTNLSVAALVGVAEALEVEPHALFKPAKLRRVRRGRPKKD